MNVLEKILEEIEERVGFRERLVKYEERIGTITDACRNKGALEELDIIARIIRSHMDEMNNDDWIPVEERLPEEKINPITKDFYVYPVTFELDGVRDIRYYPFGMGHWWKATEIMDEYVKAWMPIPASYNPKEKNNE